MQLVSLSQLKPIIADKSLVINAVRAAFIDHSRGNIEMPPPVQMIFRDTETSGADNINGDCHVKTAYSTERPYFCIKVATGFYRNPTINLSVNSGLVMLLSAETGRPLALLQDDGHMTAARTAAAGALAAGLRMKKGKSTLGIVGTGHQAELQARWITHYCRPATICIWGRTLDHAKTLSQKLADLDVNVRIASNLRQVCDAANVIVTVTPSETPILNEHDIKPGQHLVAIGSDSPGKMELAPEILAKAKLRIVDDYHQCLEHGDFGNAVRSGLINQENHMLFGDVLQQGLDLRDNDISVVDLTGLGAQDLAIASLVWENIIYDDRT